VHICYYDSTNGNLKYAVGRGSTWDTDIADGDQYDDVGEYCDIALNSTGLPGISYFKASAPNVWYVYFDGDDWSTPEHVEPDASPGFGYSGEYTSIKYGSNDVPHISYSGDIWQQGNTRNLKYAWRTGVPPMLWSIQVVDWAELGGYYSSLELTTDTDDAVIAYQRVNPATAIGSLWLVEQLSGWWQAPVPLVQGSGQPGAGMYTSLELGPEGRKAVVCADQTSTGPYITASDLKFRAYNDLTESWEPAQTVDDEGSYLVGFHSSLAFDPSIRSGVNCYPAISYMKRLPSSVAEYLMFARWW